MSQSLVWLTIFPVEIINNKTFEDTSLVFTEPSGMNVDDVEYNVKL